LGGFDGAEVDSGDGWLLIWTSTRGNDGVGCLGRGACELRDCEADVDGESGALVAVVVRCDPLTRPNGSVFTERARRAAGLCVDEDEEPVESRRF